MATSDGLRRLADTNRGASLFVAPGITRLWRPSHAACSRITGRKNLGRCASTRWRATYVGGNNAESVVRELWRRTAKGAFVSTMSLFSKDAVYHDMIYKEPFSGEDAIRRHMTAMEDAIPIDKLVFVLDDVFGSAENKVAARWHLEAPSGRTIPFTSGMSIYNLEADDDGKLRIVEAWDYPEPTFKVGGLAPFVLKLISNVFK